MPAIREQIPVAHNIGDMIDGQLEATPGQYQFPEDQPKYHTTFTFTAYSLPQTPGSLGQAGRDFAAFLKGLGRDAFPGEAQDIEDAFDTIGQRYEAVLKEQRITMPAVARQQTTDTVVLPLPVNLMDVHKVHWDEKTIMPWANLLGAATAPISGFYGLAPNFFQTILFDRPEYKRHELAFKLSPRNFRESTAIRDVIQVFNNAMSPSSELGGALWGFPNVVHTTLRPNNGWLYKFKPAVVETFAINYIGGEGKKAFYHGQSGGDENTNPPESVEITLHLLEIEYWLKDQFTIISE